MTNHELGEAFDYLRERDLKEMQDAYPDFVITHVHGQPWFALPLHGPRADYIQAGGAEQLARQLDEHPENKGHEREQLRRRGAGGAWTGH